MRIRVPALLLLATLLVALSGCQKLNYEKTFSLEAGNVQEIEFSAPSYQQKVTVTITSTAAGVSAYLLKSSDLNAVKADLDRSREPAAGLLLASRVSTAKVGETYSFEATIPAKTAYVLLLKNTKKTDASVKLVGR